ncbi:MAG: peroxiredoxin [Bacteroidota bacterium]
MKLQIGDTIPHFRAKDTNGNNFDSKEVIGIKPTVIYFYPKDNTPGCTAQACDFRDQYGDFKKFGAEIIGVSGDSTESHQKFTKQYQLPFILLSDSDKEIRKLFGVPTNIFGLLPGRVTYVADKNGKIVLVYNSISAKNHQFEALEALKKLE